MNIAFDLHGVLDKYPEIFKPMIKMLRLCGDKVYVISGLDADSVRFELVELGYNNIFNGIYSVVDFLKRRDVDFKYDKNGNPWCDEQIWWDTKARICKALKIGILIDDSLKYKAAFDLIDSEYVHISELGIGDDDNELA